MPDLMMPAHQESSLDERHRALKRVLREQADALAAAGADLDALRLLIASKKTEHEQELQGWADNLAKISLERRAERERADAEIEASRLLIKAQKAEHELELQGWIADLAKIEAERQAEREQSSQNDRLRQAIDEAQAELAHRDTLAKAAELERTAELAEHRREIMVLQDARDLAAAERDILKGRIDDLQAEIDQHCNEITALRTEIDENAGAYEAIRQEARESRHQMVSALRSEEELQAALSLERLTGQERLRLAHAAADLRLGELQTKLDAHQARARRSALSLLQYAFARLRRRAHTFASSAAMTE